MWYGPQSQIGLIWTSPPSRKRTPVVPTIRPRERGAWPGKAGTPTIVCSVCAFRRRNCVWCRIATSSRCAPSSSPIRIGKIRTCAMYMRGQSCSLPGNIPSEQPVHEVLADERDREPHRVADHEPHPRHEVVDERVADVRLEEREREHRHPEPVRQLARLPVRAGEEDAEEVEDDGRDEHVRRPVVRLPEQQARAHGERQVHHRRVGLAHPLAVERRVVVAVEDDLLRRVDEEERQVDPGRNEDDEGVERDLAEQERPVVGKEIAQRLAQERRARGALVEPADGAARDGCSAGNRHGCAFQSRTPHHDGPTGPSKLPFARR